MGNINYDKLRQEVISCFNPKDICKISPPTVRIKENVNCGSVVIEVDNMYNYLPITYSVIDKLSLLFKTDKFNVNHYHVNGCVTCDWGSCYVHLFEIPNQTFLNEWKNKSDRVGYGGLGAVTS